MDRVTVRYATFYAPGSFVANVWTKPVASLAPHSVEWPDNAYAFTLHERIDVMDGPETFEGKASQVGPMYYHPDSKLETLADVEARNDPRESILRSNMRINKYEAIVRSRWGNWCQPFDASTDCILEKT